VEIIKAPKITLPGLKIKGKIELPEIKKKPLEDKEETVSKPTKKISETPRSQKRSRKGRKPPEDYNPIAEARKRKAKEEKRKRISQAKRKKEMRRRRYEQEIQSKPKSHLRNKSEKSQMKDSIIEYSGNVFQRFWHWLNT